MSQAPEGITPGGEDCSFGTIGRTSPLINGPTGTWVYVINKLFAAPTGTNQFQLYGSSDLYYSGTSLGPVVDWADIANDQIPTPTFEMNSWDIGSGWTASAVQYVWDAGVWYISYGALCEF